MHDVEVFLLLGVCGLCVFLFPLLLALVLWSKVSQLRTDMDALQLRVRKLTAGEIPLAPQKAPATVAASEIEVVAKPPAAVVAPVLETAAPPQPVGPAEPAHQRPPQPMAERTKPEEPVKEPFSLEELLAGKWLTWVAALALIIGAGLGFKYAIDNQWIDEKGRIALGLLVGAAAFAGGAFAMVKDYRWLGQALAGAAAGILYFAIYAGYGFYDKLIPLETTFAGMVIVTIALLAFSVIFNAQSTAIIGLIGGFLTPLMLSTGVDRQRELFGYIFLLDLGVLGIASFRRWQPLQITAFCFTILLWLGWFANFYEPAKLETTLILMTAFFALFALLGVWHNSLRRLPAQPGDLFLMLATPVVYFVALYAVTKSQYESWHGLMAVGLGAVYVGFAALQMARNPAGKLAVLSLAGVAASFLTVAIPLQLTGHWIAIAWAAESLLLVELGFKFQQPKLRWAGFGLLCVVQLILFSYTAETFDSPRTFNTRFIADPGAEFIPGVADGGAAPAEPTVPAWTDVFNGRSLSFLASALVMAILAWEYRRRGRTLEENDSDQPSGWFAVMVPLTLLGMLCLETYSLAYLSQWSEFTVLGVITAWTAAAALVVVWMSLAWGPRWLERIGAGLFALVGLLLLLELGGTLTGWRSEWSYLNSKGVPQAFWWWPIANPRGLGFIAAIVAAAISAAMIVRSRRSGAEEEGMGDASGAARSGDRPQLPLPLPLSSLLGVFAHLSGLALLTTEVYAQGVVREWHTWTALSITIVWLLYAMATLVAGIYYRSATVRVLALLLFALTAGKVFFYDVWQVTAAWKTVAFMSLGVALMLVSYFYRRHRDRIRAWVKAASFAGAAILVSQATPAFADETLPPLQTLANRWSITAPTESDQEYVGIKLPAEVYSVARDDLADIRILAVNEQTKTAQDVPYFLVQPSDRITFQDRPVELLNLSQTADGTEFLVDLGDDPTPIREIVIDVATGTHNYQHDVRVFGGDSRTATDALLTGDGLLFDVARNTDHVRLDRVAFPRSQFQFYRVVIDNPSLPVTGARVTDREETRAPRHAFPAEIIGVKEDSERRCTVVLADLHVDRLPTTGVNLEVISSGDFHRRATIESADVLDDERRWRLVTSCDVYRITRTGHATRESLATQHAESRGRYLRITIENGDDQPLTVQKVTAEGIDRWLVCERNQLQQDGRTVALFAGDERRSAPQYDLARTIGDVDVGRLESGVQTGQREQNPFFTGPTVPRQPWSVEHQGLVWTLTIAGVAVFGGLTALLLWKAAGTSPPAA
ncbi:MAG: DUF2339 domain-containing protein [Planctomycetaceae bacterium]|nr:DUF2339 domain-containing protein [Planctomycetaceae bacterium]